MSDMLRVAGWNERYETHETRKLRSLRWVPLPNQMDGDGYTELVEGPHGAENLAAWVAILEIASRCEPRGTLSRSRPASRENLPHDRETLARISRLSPEIFSRAIPKLLEIGWLEKSPAQAGESPATPGENPGEPGKSPGRIEGNGTEGKEENGREPTGKQPPPKPAEKWQTDEERTQWVRDALLDFVADVPGWTLPPPDDALCQRIMATVGKEHLPVIGQVLKELHQKGKRPSSSWGWFPLVIEEWLRPRRVEPILKSDIERVMA